MKTVTSLKHRSISSLFCNISATLTWRKFIFRSVFHIPYSFQAQRDIFARFCINTAIANGCVLILNNHGKYFKLFCFRVSRRYIGTSTAPVGYDEITFLATLMKICWTYSREIFWFVLGNVHVKTYIYSYQEYHFSVFRNVLNCYCY